MLPAVGGLIPVQADIHDCDGRLADPSCRPSSRRRPRFLDSEKT
jgi:hypothetical protein